MVPLNLIVRELGCTAGRRRAEALPMSIPTHYIKKRDLLHSEKSSPAALSRVGREFLEKERFSDALDFFEKARDMEAIRGIKEAALNSGDTFLLGRLDRFD